jgi:hypothetical protein
MDNVQYHIRITNQPLSPTFRESVDFIIIRQNCNIPWSHFLAFVALKLRHLSESTDYVIQRSHCFSKAV